MPMNVVRFRGFPTLALAAVSLTVAAGSGAAAAQDRDDQLAPNHIVVSRSVYSNRASNVSVGQPLPPNCGNTSAGCAKGSAAQYDGIYPFVFNNALVDGSFGITSAIYLDQFTLGGRRVSSMAIPTGAELPSRHRGEEREAWRVFAGDHLVTSFPSKSELALHLSTDRHYLTFMGYVAPVDALDVSNSNTPLVIDPTNPDGQTPFYRAIANIGPNGRVRFTEVNAYSGNNGRAAIYNERADVFYTAGNAGNGGNPQPNGVILGAGAQIAIPENLPEVDQNPGFPTPVASFNLTALGQKADKVGKDDNFRGMTVFNNVLYYTKGSGGNGVNTVYFVDTTGKACPTGVGLPAAGAKLPTAALPYDPATLQTAGLPTNMCVLAGFPTAAAKTANPVSYPFGLWFANSTTLYVADEGDGYAAGADLYTHAATQTTAGLQKWTLDTATQTWKLAYVLKEGLRIGTPYTVAGYPAGVNPATKLPWAPATDGLRNIAGVVDRQGRATVWAVTSTVSGSGDQGADPNRIYTVRDRVANTDAAKGASATFVRFDEAKFAEVLRGVSLTPESDVRSTREDDED